MTHNSELLQVRVKFFDRGVGGAGKRILVKRSVKPFGYPVFLRLVWKNSADYDAKASHFGWEF